MSTTGWIVLTAVMTGLSIYLFTKYNYYRSLVKQRGSFGRWPVKMASLPELDPIFTADEFGPTLDTEVKFIGRGHLVVPGGTSDAEAWVLSVLARKAKRMFEFGTCTGKTAYLMAENSSPDAKVFTLTLPPAQIQTYNRDTQDSERATREALSESTFAKFLYSGTSVENKITQIFCDSKQFDEKPFENQMDLIFIDGSHALSYVNSDSMKAFRMVSPGGLILWHDYRGPFQTLDVYKALNQLSKEKKLRHIEGTSLVAYRN